MMQTLMDAGANVNDADGSGMPIISAFSAKHHDAVELLVNHGVAIPDLLKNMAKIAMARVDPAAARALGLDTDIQKKPKKPKSKQDANELTEPGYFPGVGDYIEPCAAEVNYTRPNTRPGDTGSSVLIYSIFKDVARGRCT